MRNILILMLFASPLLAVHQAINCATTYMGTTYSSATSSAQLQFQNMVSVAHLKIINSTGSRICMDVGSTVAGVIPTSGGPNEHCVQATDTESWDGPTINNFGYIRADVAPCTTGTFDVDIF
jgi:uncharacterized hydantoinase/oxoprolinase family protein